MTVKCDKLWNRYSGVFADHLECLAFGIQDVFLVAEESNIMCWWALEHETAAICKSSDVDLPKIALDNFHLLNCDF